MKGTQAFPGRKGFNRGGVDGYLEIHSGIKIFGRDLSLAVEREDEQGGFGRSLSPVWQNPRGRGCNSFGPPQKWVTAEVYNPA